MNLDIITIIKIMMLMFTSKNPLLTLILLYCVCMYLCVYVVYECLHSGNFQCTIWYCYFWNGFIKMISRNFSFTLLDLLKFRILCRSRLHSLSPLEELVTTNLLPVCISLIISDPTDKRGQQSPEHCQAWPWWSPTWQDLSSTTIWAQYWWLQNHWDCFFLKWF